MTVPDPAAPAPPGPNSDRELAAARRTARIAQLLAAGAVAVAVIAVIVSMTALAKAGRAGGSAAATTTTGSPSEPATTTRPVTSSSENSNGITPSTSLDNQTVRPDADFEVVYERQALRILPQESCGYTRAVDLDEPRVGVAETIAEFQYGKICANDKTEINLADGIAVSQVADTATARDCAEAIRNGPINEPVVATEQTTLCVVTSAVTAEAEGISRKIVLMTIDSIAEDGAMNLRVTAWSVPN